MLRKYNKLDPDALRYPPNEREARLLSIYSQLYLIEAGAWYVNHRDWLLQVLDEGCVGGIPGKEAMMASWDVQSEIASHIQNKQSSVAAFLDYYKFFDSFDPRLFSKFLAAHGIADDLVALFEDLNVNSLRFIKIGNTLVAPLPLTTLWARETHGTF